MPKVIIQDNQGNILGEFQGEKATIFTDMTKKNGVEIPFSCGVGACGICKCEIIKGQEFINKEMMGVPAMNVPENQVLTCIAGLKNEAFEQEDLEIILQRLF